MASNTPLVRSAAGPISVLKPTFSGGEWSPSLQKSITLEKYSTAARTLRNVIVAPQGGASNRPGTLFVAMAKSFSDGMGGYLDKRSRMVPFEFSTSQRYAIEAGDFYFRFFTEGGQIITTTAPAWVTATPYVVGDFVMESSVIYYCIVAHTSGVFATDLAANRWVAQTIYEIPGPYSDTQVLDFQYAQSADVLFIAQGDVKPKQLNRMGNTDWSITDYAFEGGPFMLNNTTAVTLTASAVSGSGVTLTASAATFFPGHVGSIWRLRHYIEGQTSSVSVTATGAQTGIKCGGTWRIITHGTWTARFNVERSIDGGTSWQVIRTFSSVNDNNVSTFQTDDNDGDPYLIRINTVAYTSGTINIDLTTDPFTQEGWIQITGYTSSTVLTGTVTREIGLTTATTNWAEGSWSDYRGWPSTVSFAQDRLTWGGTRTEPQTDWMTETGNYYSFRRHTPLIATDGISVPLPSRQLNAINWLLPLGVLIAGTSSLIWTISASDKILAPNTVTQTPSDYNGAARVMPIIIGTRAIYVQAGGSVIRDLAFSFTDDGYVSTNISILATHLFNNYRITELAYQPNPYTVMWAIRSDGQMLSMTYLREQEVLAWTHHDTDGLFESICKVQGPQFDELWLSVKRGTDNRRYIETFANRMVSRATRDQIFLDSAIIYNDVKAITAATQANPVVLMVASTGYVNGDLIDVAEVVGMTQLNGKRFKLKNVVGNTAELTNPEDDTDINGTGFSAYISGGTSNRAVSVITGLGHLEGANVGILGDGNVIANYLNPKVVVGGSVDLDGAAYSKVIIGRPYLADVETLNIEAPTGSGAAMGRKVKISTVSIEFEDTLGGLIGPSFDNLHEIGQAFSRFYDTAAGLFTGDFPENLGAGYEDGGKICIRQADPLPMTILSLVPDVKVGGKSLVTDA